MILITGASGFVGPYLRNELEANGHTVVGTDRSDTAEYSLDITDREAVKALIAKIKPEMIVHLAGFSSVSQSFKQPDLCRKINVEGTRNVLDAVKANTPQARILVVSSSDVYGNPAQVPINEEAELNPLSPYAESRVEQEGLVREYDLNWIISRSFNHIGPGQPLGFVTSDFASQIAAINLQPDKAAEILVGNLDAEKDFSDVRDVVYAYRLLLEKAKSGNVYNVASGKGTSIRTILETLLSLSEREIAVQQDPSRLRSKDIVKIIGDNSKLIADTGWEAKYSLETTLKDVYSYWQANL